MTAPGRLTVADIRVMRACEALDQMPLGDAIDKFFRRSVASQKGHRKRRLAESETARQRHDQLAQELRAV